MQANKALASRAPELALCQAEKARPFHRASQSHRHRMPGERHDLIQDTPLVPGQILCCWCGMHSGDHIAMLAVASQRVPLQRGYAARISASVTFYKGVIMKSFYIYVTHAHTHTITSDALILWEKKNVTIWQRLQPHGLHSPRNSPGQNTGFSRILQGIVPSQQLNQGLLHCRQILYQLSYEGSPTVLRDILKEKQVPVLRKRSRPCIWHRYQSDEQLQSCCPVHPLQNTTQFTVFLCWWNLI